MARPTTPSGSAGNWAPACAPIARPRSSCPEQDAALPIALITRPEAQSAELSARLAVRGFSPVIAPLYAVRHRPMRAPPGVQAIVITSANAVPALPHADMDVFAVGDATASRVRAQGYARVCSAGADARALAALIAARADPASGPLLLASGAGQGLALAADLRRRGFRVVRRVCYDVAPARRFPAAAKTAIRSGELAVAVFLSAETARIFVRLLPPECNEPLSSVIALAIGRSTEEALLPLPWLRIRRAETPTLDDVLALI